MILEAEDPTLSVPKVPRGEASWAALQACLADANPGLGSHAQSGAAAARQAMQWARQLGADQELGRAGAWLCTHLLRLGEYEQLQREALQLLPVLAAQASVLADERRETLHGLVLAASEMGAFDVALDAAQQLAQLATGWSDRAAPLAAAFAMAVCLERMGDSWQSLRVLRQALAAHAARAGQGDVPNQPVPTRAMTQCLNALCAVAIGLFHRVKDVAPPAELKDLLHQARDAAEQVLVLNPTRADVRLDIAVWGNLSEVLLHQGELARSEAYWQRAHDQALAAGMRAYVWRLQTTRADWLLVAGHAAQAQALIQALIVTMGDQAPQQTAIRARQSAYRACRDLGDFAAALQHFEAMERLERQRVTSQLRAQSELFVTRTEAQQALWQADSARRDAVRERQRADEQTLQAELDALTLLGNRRHMGRRWTELMAQYRDTELSLAVALVDVDHFKQVNDRHGHATGDQVLVELAALLRQATRGSDVLARMGGEEFVVLWPQMSPAEATEACERLRAAVQTHDWSHLLGRGVGVTVSVGLSAAPPLDMTLLLARADQALYRAKASGRNRVCVV